VYVKILLNNVFFTSEQRWRKYEELEERINQLHTFRSVLLLITYQLNCFNFNFIRDLNEEVSA
jgi:hypothetical protein